MFFCLCLDVGDQHLGKKLINTLMSKEKFKTEFMVSVMLLIHLEYMCVFCFFCVCVRRVCSVCV